MSWNEIAILRESNEPFVTCFEFVLMDKQRLFLTSSNQGLQVDNKNYLPYSGLNLDRFEFNDSAHNYIQFSGIFESEGINNTHILDGSEVSIFFYFINKKSLSEWITYSFSKIEHDGMRFIITLASDMFKTYKSLLQHYSPSCRAVFGDSECGIDTSFYANIYDIIEVKNSEIRISGCSKPDGFYANGKARFDNGISYDILEYRDSNILLSMVPCDIKNQIKVILTPGCDKNITTCCNNYGNAINFRGEPFMP